MAGRCEYSSQRLARRPRWHYSDAHSLCGCVCVWACRVKVVMPPTDDESALLAGLDGLKAAGPTNIVQGIKIAMVRRSPCA